GRSPLRRRRPVPARHAADDRRPDRLRGRRPAHDPGWSHPQPQARAGVRPAHHHRGAVIKRGDLRHHRLRQCRAAEPGPGHRPGVRGQPWHTLTSWLVAVAGFNLNLRALALPAIGLGGMAWAISRTSRWGALGQAVAGFGLFFLGIDVLRDAFDGLGGMLSVQGQDADTAAGIATFVLSGIAITLLTQSSSATLAITLTAAAGGLLPLQAAAAMIVGANV